MNELQNIRLSIIENKIVSLKNQIGRNMIEIGNELIKAKEEVNHGEWEKWLKNKVAFSQRSAEQLMRIAKEFGSNSQAISNLGVTKAGLLLGIPNEKREEFIEKNDVKSMSTRELKKAIKQSIDNEHYGNVIDLEMDMEEYDIPIRDLKELPEHNEFFASRKGKEWIDFLNAIDKYGVTKPIKISRDKTIIDGHERVRACKDLGIDTIKCKYAFEKEQNRKNYTDEQLKLKLFFYYNMWENTRSHIYYLAQFLLDTLFDENYGDGSGDITHYLTDERMERIEHNNKIMDKMYEVVEMKISGSITEDEMGVMIHELHEQYI